MAKRAEADAEKAAAEKAAAERGAAEKAAAEKAAAEKAAAEKAAAEKAAAEAAAAEKAAAERRQELLSAEAKSRANRACSVAVIRAWTATPAAITTATTASVAADDMTGCRRARLQVRVGQPTDLAVMGSPLSHRFKSSATSSAVRYRC